MRQYQLEFELFDVHGKNKYEPLNKKMFEIIILTAISVRDKVYEIFFEYIRQALEKKQHQLN